MLSQICKAYSVDRGYFDGKKDLSSSVTLHVDSAHPGQRLRVAREEKGWTQAELAARSNVLSTVISKAETTGFLTEKQGVKLAEALEVGFEWLMKGDKNRKRWPLDQALTLQGI